MPLNWTTGKYGFKDNHTSLMQTDALRQFEFSLKMDAKVHSFLFLSRRGQTTIRCLSAE